MSSGLPPQILISNVLDSLKFEFAKPSAPGAAPECTVTKDTISYLESIKGKSINIDFEGNLTVEE